MKKKMLGCFALLLAVALSVSVAAFAKLNTYTDGRFEDVPTSEWYASEVIGAYELGFMNGVSDTAFNPNGNITVAEAITVAARMHAADNGKTVSTVGTYDDWFVPYVRYAESNGLLTNTDLDDYERNARRKEFAVLLYNALSSDSYPPVNAVEEVPDVPAVKAYAPAVLALYRAGVLMGSDEYGSFLPESDILRCEAAAIIHRAAIPEKRLRKTLAVDASEDAYVLCYNTDYTNSHSASGESSGWRLDNRGGTVRKSVKEPYTGLYDISTEYGTALIRELNTVSRGCITMETSIHINAAGGYMEFSDASGQPVYQLMLADAGWSLLTKMGEYQSITAEGAPTEMTAYTFRLYLDMDAQTAVTYINDVCYGASALLSDSISSFRFATDAQSTLTLIPGAMQMTVNYAAYETFEAFGVEDVYGWKKTGEVQVKDKELVLEGISSIEKTVEPQNGRVIFEWYQNLPEGDALEVSLKKGATPVLVWKALDGKFMLADQAVYTFTPNMWYRVRIALNTESGEATAYLNGRVVGTAQTAVGTIDGFGFSLASGTAAVDNLHLYTEAKHPDYVPVPETEADLNDYIVGVNVCSLWRNGYSSIGWSAISPYAENTPVLGYYDEGTPESADWEIKYMVEHGIDFQAFCWYADGGKPIKTPRNSYQLHDGYMYARYSDYMKYVIIWETYGGSHCKQDYFRSTVVPYWFENYFLDERYLKLENRIVLPIYAAYMLKRDDYFGSVEGVRAELDYLESVAQSYGFDGFIFLANDFSTDEYAAMGFDASFAYHWGEASHEAAVNKASILASAKCGSMHTVPTLSVGYDARPWYGGERTGLMPADDYKKTAQWIKDEYLTAYGEDGWKGKTVWLSTWNEYGEGTFIMPTEGYGFRYTDAVRDVFGDGKNHEDVLPTKQQKARITHLYPQTHTLLRRTSTVGNDPDFKLAETVSELVGSYAPTAQSTVVEKSENVVYADDLLSATANGKTPAILYYGDYSDFDASDIVKISVTLKGKAGRTGKLYFATKTDPYLTADKCFTFTTDSDERKTYDIYTSGNALFNGTLTVLRIDPFTCQKEESLDYEIGKIEIYTNGSSGKSENTTLFEAFPNEEYNVVEQSDNVSFVNGVLSAVSAGADPKVQFPYYFDDLLCEDIAVIAIELQGHAGKPAQLFFATEESPLLSADKCFTVNVDSNEIKTYYIKTSTNTLFKGKLKLLRVDPFDGTKDEALAYRIGKITFVGNGSKDPEAITGMTVNGVPVENDIAPVKKDGLYLFPYATETGIGYLLNTDTVWNRTEGTLSIIGTKHTLVYTVGKDTYRLDGKERPLGYALYSVDGIPMLNFEQLCTDMELSFTEENGIFTITTPQKELFEQSVSVPGRYDFSGYNLSGWKSAQMFLVPLSDSLLCTSKDTGRDPQLVLSDASIDTAKVTSVKLRCRYRYTAKESSYIQLFFITDRDAVWNEEKSVRIPLKSLDSQNQWEEYSVSLAALSGWQGTVTSLRVDPFAGYGTMEYDYILFE